MLLVSFASASTTYYKQIKLFQALLHCLLSVVIIQASKSFPSLLWGGGTSDHISPPPPPHTDLEVVLADRLKKEQTSKA